MSTICDFEILAHICTLKTERDNWTKEFNIVKWKDHEPKYDIREWSPTHEYMTTGCTLSHDEMEQIFNAYSDIK